MAGDAGERVARVRAARHRDVRVAQHPFPTRPALYRSTDQGATFSKVAEAYSEDGLFNDVAFSSNPARVYALDNRRVLRSDDGGATWLPMAFLSGLFDPYVYPQLAVDAAVPDKVYVATTEGILASTDAGANFAFVDRSSGAPGRPRSIAVDASDPMRQWLVARTCTAASRCSSGPSTAARPGP
jgi:hypothetical protein